MKLPVTYRPFMKSMEWPWRSIPTAVDKNGTVWPKITIVTPSYNQGVYLEQTIRSVLLQEYPNLEYIVMDGGSSDESVEIIRHYSSFLKYWISQPDKGQADALVNGFAHGTGSIFAWINSDDYYEPGAFFAIARCFLDNDVDFVSGTCNMIDPGGKQVQLLNSGIISYGSLLRYWRPHFCPPQPSLFFSSAAWNDLGGLNTSLNYTMDFDLWLRGISKYKFHSTGLSLSVYRVHELSKTGSHGGLAKFIPEWRACIVRSLAGKGVFVRLSFYAGEMFFLFTKRLKKHSDLKVTKNRFARWISKMPVYVNRL